MNRKLNVWDLMTGKKLGMVGREYEHPREDFIVFPDGRRLAQGSITNSITIIDLETGKLIREIAPPGMVPSAFRVTPEGGQLVWASEAKQAHALGFAQRATGSPAGRCARRSLGLGLYAGRQPVARCRRQHPVHRLGYAERADRPLVWWPAA